MYDTLYLEYKSTPSLVLNGNKEEIIDYGTKYVERGALAYFRDKDISYKVTVNSDGELSKVGTVLITYSVTVHGKSVNAVRTVIIKDEENPEITLKGEPKIVLTTGQNYNEPGYTAIDNYDGDITDKVIIESNVDNKNAGDYEIKYIVTDTNGNSNSVTRKVKYNKPVVVVKKLPDVNAVASKIAVLNYHFFYDKAKGQYGGGNSMSTDNLEKQLAYLKENQYKTLTMEEFRALMYGEIELPARSVLITIDDGGNGTGFSNGNYLIPLLEKYDINATLFLITAWWKKDNYTSNKLEVESHGHDLHFSGYCSGVSRGAKMLCLNKEEVLSDLKLSIALLQSNIAFCFPFYAYNNTVIDLVKEVGFKLAFIGGDYKATRSTDKYKIPRYHMYDSTTLTQFINMIA